MRIYVWLVSKTVVLSWLGHVSRCGSRVETVCPAVSSATSASSWGLAARCAINLFREYLRAAHGVGLHLTTADAGLPTGIRGRAFRCARTTRQPATANYDPAMPGCRRVLAERP